MTTQMRQEIAQIPEAVARLLEHGQAPIVDAATRMRHADPTVIVTAARGSSDCVATYFKYACELRSGVPVASIGPSIVSAYGAPLRLSHTVMVAISQSGQSPDIGALAAAGAPNNIAIVNDTTSNLAANCNSVIDIKAGPEKAVAATKTVINSAVASIQLLAYWMKDHQILDALDALPAQLEQALAQDWSALTPALQGAKSMFTLGRGPSLAIAQEAALKLKETCGLHAEAFSSGEVLHGPATLAGPGFPVVGFAAQDSADPLLAQVCDKLHAQGARALAATHRVQHAQRLAATRATHPLLDPILQLASFYSFVEAYARHLGRDPDQPRHLSKVTLTH